MSVGVAAPSVSLFAFNTAAVVTALAWNDAGRKIVADILGERSDDTALSVIVYAVLVTCIVLVIYYSFVYFAVKEVKNDLAKQQEKT